MDELLNTALVEAAVIAVFVGIIIESIKKAALSDHNLKRWLPLMALCLGVVIGLLYAVVRSEDLLLYAASGLIGGGFSSGVYDMVHSSVKKGS